MKKTNSYNVLTNDNFKEMWEQADKKYRYSKKCVVIEKFINIICAMVFAVGVIYMIVNFLLNHAINEMLSSKPFLKDIGLCYLVSLGLALAWTLLVHIIYHPFKAKYAEDDLDANIKVMAEMLDNTRKNVLKAKGSVSKIAVLIYFFSISVAILFSLFGVWDIFKLEALQGNNNIKVTFQVAGIMVGGFVVLYLNHAVFNLLTRILYYCTASYDGVVQLEYFRLSREIDFENLSDEEKNKLSEECLADGIKAHDENAYERGQELLLKAAFMGNVSAMDRLAYKYSMMDNEATAYWYSKCLESGNALEGTKKRLKAAKKGVRIENYY